MFKLPPALQPTFELLYGEDKWWRVWAMILTGCLVFLIPRNTRRLAGFAFVGIAVSACIWNFLQNSYKQYTPEPEVVHQKKWLH